MKGQVFCSFTVREFNYSASSYLPKSEILVITTSLSLRKTTKAEVLFQTVLHSFSILFRFSLCERFLKCPIYYSSSSEEAR